MNELYQKICEETNKTSAEIHIYNMTLEYILSARSHKHVCVCMPVSVHCTWMYFMSSCTYLSLSEGTSQWDCM